MSSRTENEETDFDDDIYLRLIGEKNGSKPEGLPVGMDIDFTFIPDDSGFRWFREAGLVDSREQYDEIMDMVDEAAPRGHSNQLVTFLDAALRYQPGLFHHLHSYVSDVEVEPRDGLNKMAGYRSEKEMPNIASSAGHLPVIHTTTNGYFDRKIAGFAGPETPFYNGQGEKDENMRQVLDDMDLENMPMIYLGDSNGDINGIRLAHQLGGFGIAVGQEPGQVTESVDEATLYVADEEPHYTAAALVNELGHPPEHRLTPEELRDEYGFDISGEVIIGEMADEKRQKLAEEASYNIGVDPSYI